MQYDLQIDDVSSIRRRLRFTLGGDVVREEMEKAFHDLKGRVKLPGFRPGKVPRNVLEARYGKQIRNEVGNRLIDQSYSEAATSLDVAGSPAVEERGEVSSGAPFSFTVAVDVKPVIVVKDYAGMKVDYPLVSVSDAQVEAAVSRELERRARLEELTEIRAVREGDFVLAAVKLERDGEVLADEPGTMLHTRGERYYPGVDRLVIGLEKGQTRTETVTIGMGSEYQHLKGATATATVTVNAVHEYKVPAISDELAQEMGFEGGAEGMRATQRMRLQESAETSARDAARVDLLQKIVASNPVQVPRALIDEQLQLLVEELKIRRAYSGQDPRTIRFSDAEMVDLRQRAEFAAKASVLLAGVASQEGVSVADSDLDAKIQEIADLRGQAVEAIRGYLERENAMGMLSTRILEEKVLDWLMERAELQQVDPSQRRDSRDADGEGDVSAQTEAPAADEAAPAAEATEQAAAEEPVQAAAEPAAEAAE